MFQSDLSWRRKKDRICYALRSFVSVRFGYHKICSLFFFLWSEDSQFFFHVKNGQKAKIEKEIWMERNSKKSIHDCTRTSFFESMVLRELRWLERPAQRSLRESQNGVRFPWKLRRIAIAWPRDRHVDVEEHWHRRRNQNLWNWKVWSLEVLTGRPWLPSLEGRFSVDILLCLYAMASTWKAETAS